MRRTLSLAVLLAAGPFAAQAQEATTRFYTVSAIGFAAVPVSGLADRFGTGGGGSLSFGWGDASMRYGLALEATSLPKGDVRLLTETDANRPASIALDRIALSFSTVGARFIVSRRVGRLGPVAPYLTGSVGLDRWRSVRGAYVDSTAALDLPELVQTGTSGHLSVGAGVEFGLGAGVDLTAGADYAVTMGELWPTLALGLDNISTFQRLTPRLGLRYRFGP